MTERGHRKAWLMRCPACHTPVADTRALVLHEREHPECVDGARREEHLKRSECAQQGHLTRKRSSENGQGAGAR